MRDIQEKFRVLSNAVREALTDLNINDIDIDHLRLVDVSHLTMLKYDVMEPMERIHHYVKRHCKH